MNDVILNAVVEITKNDKSNILFLLSEYAYQSYTDDREVLRLRIKDQYSESVLVNTMDTSANDADLLKYIKHDMNSNNEIFNRKILSVFTKSRTELDDLAIKCLALDDFSVYIL